MHWQRITIVTEQESAEAAASIFFDAGAEGVSIEDFQTVETQTACRPDWSLGDQVCLSPGAVAVTAYLPVDGLLDERMLLLRRRSAGLGQHFNIETPGIFVSEVVEDWADAWKPFAKTVRISGDMVVKPSWVNYAVRPGETVVEIDPGGAFGDGAHPTTLYCLRLLRKNVRPAKVVFDVGCGSGILTVVAARLGAHFVYAREIDMTAAQTARHNLAANGVEDRAEVELGNLLDGVRCRAHIVVANISAAAVMELSSQAAFRLLPGGLFIVSGIISEKRCRVADRLSNDGFSLLEIHDDGQWATITAQLRSGKLEAGIWVEEKTPKKC